jgi:hypothetical protein
MYLKNDREENTWVSRAIFEIWWRNHEKLDSLSFIYMSEMLRQKMSMTAVACTINIVTIVNYTARGVIYNHSIVPIL